MIRKYILLIGAIICLTKAYSQEKKIEKVFIEINKLIASNNIEGILKYYNPQNTDFAKKSRFRYENILKLDSLSYTNRVNYLSIEGDTAIAIVFEETNYYKYERKHSENSWQTYTLIKENNGWFINEMIERNYLQADFVELDVKIDPLNKEIIGKAKINFSIQHEGEDNILFLLNRGLKINSITDETGMELEFSRSGLAVLIPLDYKFKGGENLRLLFSYSGTLFNEYAEQNYCLGYIGEEGCFANFVTQWYPKLNSTLTKAQAILTYTVPKDLLVASVGMQVDKKEEGDMTSYTFKVTKPMDYTFNANKFTFYSNVVNNVPVNVFLFNGNPKKAEMYATKAPQLLSFLSDYYGIFPFDSYSISEVPSSITRDLGGSGGQGLNFYPEIALRDTIFEFPLLAHEIGHMWWGSWVMGKENTGSLFDEAFAQFSSVLCYRYFYGERAMWEFLNDGTGNYSQSAKLYFQRYASNDIPLGHYDVNSSANLTMLARVKAHFVYAMLMETVGYYAFEKGIKRVIYEYANKRIGLDDFKKIIEEESGLNLDYFFEQWFYRAGAPEFAINYSVSQMDDGRYKVSGLVTQKREIYNVNAEIELTYDYNRTIQILKVDKKETSFSYITEAQPQAVIFDPDRKILRWSEEVAYLPLLEKGMMSIISGNNEEAIDSLAKYLEYQPYDATGNGLVGIAYVNSQQYEKALKYLLYAEERYANEGGDRILRMHLFLAMGELYFETANPKKAKIYFEKVLLMFDFMGAHAKAHSYLEKISKLE